MARALLYWCALVLAAMASGVESKCERTSSVQVRTFVIDLDEAPRDRFKEAAASFKDIILKWYIAEKQKLDFKLLTLFEEIGTNLDDYFPHPFNEEIRGIAEALEMSVGDVVIANILYELTAFCTGIVAQQPSGRIIHGRNLDYDFSDILQNMTYIAQYQRNGTLLFTSAQLAGYIGVITGHKHNAFTFSLNERDQGEWWVNFLFAFLDRKAKPVSFLSRELMENTTSFVEAVDLLAKSDLIAPIYFIVGGVASGEGVVLTRSQAQLVDLWRLNTAADRWYLLETNYDHWVPPPPNDDRRTPGMKAMNATTQARIDYSTMFDVLSITPVCNNFTVYSVVMSAADEGADGFQIIVH